jgi:STE24 endopeptidase
VVAPSLSRVAAATAAVGAVAFVTLAVLFVPWDPVPGGVPAPVSADDVFTADEIARAEDFYRSSRLWSWSSLAVSLAVACWLGFGRRGRALAARTRGPWWVRAVVVVVALVTIGRLVTLPFAIALRRLLLDEGLSTSDWPSWTLDLVKGELVDIVVTSIAVIALLGCARRWRRAWPAVAGGLLAALVVAGSFAYPLVVEPLFNDFEPMPDSALRTQILDLADEEDVAVDEVLVADASRRTTTLNAYVSGIGSSRRVVVYDTLLADRPPEQVLSVVAHELAHAQQHDVLIGTALGAAGALFGVGLLGLAVGWLGRRGRPGLGRDDGVAGVPQLLALVAIATVVAMPVQNGISRQIETRADVIALQATADEPGGVEAFVALQVRLAQRSLADPTPPGWAQWWFGSHPTVLERVALGRSFAD